MAGLRNLYREGVNLEVMSADAVLEEMRVDEVAISDEERVKHYISARSAWTIPPMKFRVGVNQYLKSIFETRQSWTTSLN